MNRRTPTSGEAHYEKICRSRLGCIACAMDGRPWEDPNEDNTAFHHDPHFGSKKPGCHYHAIPLCPLHHQGINAPKGFLFRHGNESRFEKKYAPDEVLNEACWAYVSRLDYRSRLYNIDQDVIHRCPFDELKAAA